MKETKFIQQGDLIVSNDKNLEIITVLGSCVSVCLYDKILKIGGMNHFFLPYCINNCNLQNKYGEYAIPNLIKGMLKLGSDKKDIIAKIYGGAKVIKSSQDIGQKNIDIAKQILSKYDIPILSENINGTFGRKIFFSIDSGNIRVEKTKEMVV